MVTAEYLVCEKRRFSLQVGWDPLVIRRLQGLQFESERLVQRERLEQLPDVFRTGGLVE